MTFTKQDRLAALDEAVERAGGIVRFSRALGLTHQAVYDWRKRGWVPIARAIASEAIFGVPKEKLMEPSLAAALTASDLL